VGLVKYTPGFSGSREVHIRF